MHYHPNTNNLEKKTVKPSFTIQAYIKCAKCGKTFDRAIDSVEHFKSLVEKNGWKRIDFVKSNENSISGAKDVHGICCSDCRKDIDEWEEGNPHPRNHKTAENTTKLVAVLAAGAALVNQVEQDLEVNGHS
jgi:hypothetical protein